MSECKDYPYANEVRPHVYVYNGTDYRCKHCGNLVKYDVMNRDFKGVK